MSYISWGDVLDVYHKGRQKGLDFWRARLGGAQERVKSQWERSGNAV